MNTSSFELSFIFRLLEGGPTVVISVFTVAFVAGKQWIQLLNNNNTVVKGRDAQHRATISPFQ